MRLVSALSTAPAPEDALREVSAVLEREAAGPDGTAAGPMDLAFVFAAWPGDALERLAEDLFGRIGARQLIGCNAGGLIGAGHEAEGRPGLAVAALQLGDCPISIRHIHERDLPGPDSPPAAWRDLLGHDADSLRGLCLLADPFTADVDRLLTGLDYAYPRAPKFGGLASGGASPNDIRLLHDDAAVRGGALMTCFGPGVRCETVVAQGCMPIGHVGTITRADGNSMLTINDQPALRFLEEQIRSAGDTARQGAQGSPLFLGIEMDPFQLDQPSAGEFLVRHLMGFDQSTGAVVVGAELQVGRRVQLHLRDAASSAADLERCLQGASNDPAPFGALLFSCLGRGQGLYGQPDHDSNAFAGRFPDTPLAGFFCGGEIGPVAGTTHLHGYTSAFALLHAEDE